MSDKKAWADYEVEDDEDPPKKDDLSVASLAISDGPAPESRPDYARGRDRSSSHTNSSHSGDRGRDGGERTGKKAGEIYAERLGLQGGSSGSGNGSGSQPMNANKPLPTSPPFVAFVGNLSFDVTWEELGDFFFKGGCDVERVDVHIDPDGRPKGYAHVEFKTLESLKTALEANGYSLKGRVLRVDSTDTKQSRGGDRRNAPGMDSSRSSATSGPLGPADEVATWERSKVKLPPPPLANPSRSSGDARSGGGGGGYGHREGRMPTASTPISPPSRPVINLSPRTQPIEQIGMPTAAAASIFGGGKPVDVLASEEALAKRKAEREIAEAEARAAKEKAEAEAKAAKAAAKAAKAKAAAEAIVSAAAAAVAADTVVTAASETNASATATDASNSGEQLAGGATTQSPSSKGPHGSPKKEGSFRGGAGRGRGGDDRGEGKRGGGVGGRSGPKEARGAPREPRTGEYVKSGPPPFQQHDSGGVTAADSNSRWERKVLPTKSETKPESPRPAKADKTECGIDESAAASKPQPRGGGGRGRGDGRGRGARGPHGGRTIMSRGPPAAQAKTGSSEVTPTEAPSCVGGSAPETA